MMLRLQLVRVVCFIWFGLFDSLTLADDKRESSPILHFYPVDNRVVTDIWQEAGQLGVIKNNVIHPRLIIPVARVDGRGRKTVFASLIGGGAFGADFGRVLKCFHLACLTWRL